VFFFFVLIFFFFFSFLFFYFFLLFSNAFGTDLDWIAKVQSPATPRIKFNLHIFRELPFGLYLQIPTRHFVNCAFLATLNTPRMLMFPPAPAVLRKAARNSHYTGPHFQIP